MVCCLQEPSVCCSSGSEAARKGYLECYKGHVAPSDYIGPYVGLIHSGLQRGNVDFAKQLFSERRKEAFWVAWHCVRFDDVACLQFTLDTPLPSTCRDTLAMVASRSIGCLRMLLEGGARWDPRGLEAACIDNRLDVLDVVLQHSRKWCGSVITSGACAGNTRFLMRMFEAGCPVWTSARDCEPSYSSGRFDGGVFRRPGENKREDPEDWTLVVSSNLARSGPVLLLATQKGAPMTLRMQWMLGNVRRRALALAGCFHRATRFSRKLDASAHEWNSMGKVPIDVVMRIATLARISISARDLVE